MTELIELGNQYNQAELASKLHISQSYVSMIITGKRKPSVSLTGKIKRLFNGTETTTAKWEKPHGSASVAVSFNCPQMTPAELSKLTKAIAYYASAYLRAEADSAAGLPGERPKPLP